MNKHSIKNVCLKGSLMSGLLKFNLVKNELREGIWQLSVREFGYVVKSKPASLFVQFSSNLIKDLREKNSVIENFLPSIGSAKLEGKVNEKKIVYFDPIWYQITTPDKEVCLYFKDPFDEKLVLSECEVFVTVLLQRLL
jgi:hypothetical protein